MNKSLKRKINDFIFDHDITWAEFAKRCGLCRYAIWKAYSEPDGKKPTEFIMGKINKVLANAESDNKVGENGKEKE